MNEVTLPCELAERRLSLSEIGAIFVFYSLTKLHKDAQSFWATDEDMLETGKSLAEDGIITFSKNNDDENIIIFDITAVDSLLKDFWEVWEYDKNGNTIWYHYSNCGDVDTRFRYELHPELLDNRVVWRLKHSEFGELDGYYPVESLEEGEEFVRDELRKEIEIFKQEDLLKSCE